MSTFNYVRERHNSRGYRTAQSSRKLTYAVVTATDGIEVKRSDPACGTDPVDDFAQPALQAENAFSEETQQGPNGAMAERTLHEPVDEPCEKAQHVEAAKTHSPSKKDVKRALKVAVVNVSARTFAKKWRNYADAPGISSAGCYSVSGCYVFLRFSNKNNKGKLHRFDDVYVGGSTDMGASVMRHLEGKGNPDVYADVKYGQNVRVLLFPYPPEQLRAKTQELIELLDANRSYNERNRS